MTHFSLINPQACVEIGRSDFAAAAEAGRIRRMQEHREERQAADRELAYAVQAFIASREPECQADRDEAEFRIDDAVHLASTLRALCDMVEPTFAGLQREKLAESEPQFLGTLADAFADRLSRELASVFRAALKAGVQ